jgi:adenylate cyclase
LLWQALGLVLLAGFLGLRVWDPVPAQLVRNEIFDQYQVLWPRPESTGEVVIVDLDDASLAEYGQWPWPRTLLAYMVQRLFDMGADVVAFDVVFAEADRLSPAQLAASLDGLSPALRQGLASLPDNDAIFADTIGRHPVVLGQPALHDVPAGSQLEDSGAGTVAELGRDPRPFLQRYEGLVRNLPVLEAAASGIGAVTIALDQDGVARRVPLALVVGERILPALSIEALRLRGGEPSIVIRSGENGVAAVGVAGHAVPTDRQGRIWVRYGASGSIPYIPAADILSGHLDPEAIAGRIVLVGTTAAGLFDIKRTPISPATPGVEVHAHLLETVLTDTYLKRPTTVEGAEIVAMVVASLLVIVLVPSFGALATLGVGSVVMISLALATWYLFAEHLILMDVSFAALASLTIYAVITYLKYVSEESERKTVRTAFAQYLPPAVVERLASHPEQLRLGGEARELSILFSDVRGFTSISETMAPEELATFVNRILNALTGAVLDNRGTVDKYIGDAVMALWNAPLDDAEHGRNACRGALAMVKAIEMLDHELAAALPPGAVAHRIAVGVGVNTGIAAVGNFGSDYRFDYTALGDTVNLAARLESLCPIYGCPAIVSEQTVAEAPEFATLEIDTVQVKGRKEAVRIFALVGDEQLASTAAYQRLREVHSTLLKELALNDVARATLSLDTARKLAGTMPIQGIYDRYAKRIAEMDQHARVAAPEEA